MESIDYIWEDRKRLCGLPIGFTRYRLSRDRLFCESGLANLRLEEIELYRIKDLQLVRTLGQRIFGVGTLRVYSTDTTTPRLDLINIAEPMEVKEMIHRHMEEAKLKRRIRTMNNLNGLYSGEVPESLIREMEEMGDADILSEIRPGRA